MNTPLSRQAMIFGGGTIHHEEAVDLSPVSTQRVNHFLKEHYDNPRRFTDKSSYVVCTGGYGLLAAGVEAPLQQDWREGRLMADVLVQNGFPSSKIKVEDESISTLTNWTYSLRGGLVDPENFDVENLLGLVSHPHHLYRIEDIGRRLGFKHTERIPTPEKDSQLKELVLRALYLSSLVGASTAEALEPRESKIESSINSVRKLTRRSA